MRAFFLDLPVELGEAAQIDGASEFNVFRRVMLPLAWPGVAVLAVLVFFQSWNSLLLPLLYLTGSRQPDDGDGPLPVRERSDHRDRPAGCGKPDHDRARDGVLRRVPTAIRAWRHVRRTQGLTDARSDPTLVADRSHAPTSSRGCDRRSIAASRSSAAAPATAYPRTSQENGRDRPPGRSTTPAATGWPAAARSRGSSRTATRTRSCAT